VGAGKDATHQVHGLTTAASVWLSAAVGVGAGGRLYFVSAYSVLLVMTILLVGPRIQARYLDCNYDDRDYDDDDNNDDTNDNDDDESDADDYNIDDYAEDYGCSNSNDVEVEEERRSLHPPRRHIDTGTGAPLDNYVKWGMTEEPDDGGVGGGGCCTVSADEMAEFRRWKSESCRVGVERGDGVEAGDGIGTEREGLDNDNGGSEGHTWSRAVESTAVTGEIPTISDTTALRYTMTSEKIRSDVLIRDIDIDIDIDDDDANASGLYSSNHSSFSLSSENGLSYDNDNDNDN